MSTPPEVHTLTGAYVLHALGPDEHEQFERHLARCPSCAAEVAELSEAAARLGSAVAEQPPPHLREQVLGAVADTRQLPPSVEPPLIDDAVRPATDGRTRRWWRRAGVAVAAAAIVAVAVLGGRSIVANQQLAGEVEALQQVTEEYTTLTRLLTTPDVRVVTRTTGQGTTTTAVVSHSRGTALVLAGELPEPPANHIYQAWVVSPEGARSIGLMPTSRPAQALVAHGVDPGDTVGLTVEPEGGSVQPTTPPVVLIPL